MTDNLVAITNAAGDVRATFDLAAGMRGTSLVWRGNELLARAEAGAVPRDPHGIAFAFPWDDPFGLWTRVWNPSRKRSTPPRWELRESESSRLHAEARVPATDDWPYACAAAISVHLDGSGGVHVGVALTATSSVPVPAVFAVLPSLHRPVSGSTTLQFDPGPGAGRLALYAAHRVVEVTSEPPFRLEFPSVPMSGTTIRPVARTAAPGAVLLGEAEQVPAGGRYEARLMLRAARAKRLEVR